MDRITKSILKEFQQKFDINDRNDADAFEFLMGYLVTSKFCKEDISELDYMVTGFSGGDLSIDALVILVNGEIISDVDRAQEILDGARNNYGGDVSVKFIFSQSKTSNSFDGAQILNFLNGIHRFIEEDSIDNVSPEIKEKIKIRDLIYENFTKLSNNPSVEIYYCTTGRWQETNGIMPIIQPQIAIIENSNYVSDVNFTPIGNPEIQELYKETKRGVEQTITVSHKVTLPEAVGIDQAYYGFVPLSEYIKLITNSAGDLIEYIFHDNVRDFQGLDNKTNRKISETLHAKDKAQLFFALNNGVTVIARNLKPQGEKFALYDYQVVNGCQTSHVLYEYYQETLENPDNPEMTDVSSINVPIKIIHSNNESIISQIVSATNSQTAVTDDDLMARDKYHTVLENYFNSEEDESLRLHYERRKKQYSNTDIQKIRIVAKKQMMRYFGAMFCQLPTEAARFSGRLQDRVGESIFNEKHQPAAYHFAAYGSFKLEHFFRKNRSNPENGMNPEYKRLRFHILMILPFLIFEEKPSLVGVKAEKSFHQGALVLSDDETALPVYKKALVIIDEFLDSELGQGFSLNDVDIDKKSNFTQNLIRFIQEKGGYMGVVKVK